MAVILNPEQLKLYFEGHKTHKCYQDTVNLYDSLKTHADGIVPEKLIGDRRPSESEETMEYRKKIYVPKTKNPIGKVISSLSKIRRSPDWSVKYDQSKAPSSIIEQETLEQYCEKEYPGHTSITNWMFSHFLKNYCIDANAVIAVLPINPEAGQNNEYYKPVATVFNSDQVLFFEDGAEYAILKSTDKSDLIKDDGTTIYQTGKVFLVITTTEYQRWEQTKDSSYTMTQRLVHMKGKLPVFKIRAEFLKQKDNSTIQQSRLAGMLPSLDEAAREYSDLQAAKVQHMYPLFWYYQSKACQTCGGTGKIPSTSGVTKCDLCKGSGKVKFSPYAHIEIDPPKIGETSVPAPGAGYVTRDVEIIKHQELSVKAHLFDALASINMQFLDQTPLNISGEAKSVDREELNNFVYSIAEDLVQTMDRIYWWVNEWRNALIVPDPAKREAMLPEISVPEQFDLLPADYLMDDISKAKSAKVNPILLATMEEDFANKKFYTNPEISSTIKCFYELDPLPGLSVDEKMSLLSNRGITQEDYVISAYIVAFVKRAVSEDKDFLGRTYEEKMKLISKYAREKTKVVDAAEKMKAELQAQQMEKEKEMFGQGN